MSFLTNEKPFQSSFMGDGLPRLLSVCLVTGSFSKMPRVMHQHDDRTEILLVCSGQGQYLVDGQSFTAQAGDILVYNRHVIHDESNSPEADMSVYSLAIADLQLHDRAPGQLIPPFVQPVFPSGDDFTFLRQLFDQIYTATQANDTRNVELANYLMRAMIVRINSLIEKQSSQAVRDEKLLGQEIKDYLDANYHEDINLGQISQALHINQFYLSHVFKECTGYSPMQYVIRRRIGEAQSLLLNTDLGVTKIATLVGYNNINHFHSVFLKTVGMAPGKYRKSWTSQQ